MKNYENFKTLLQDLKNNIKIVDGLILENAEKYIISRKVNGIWELIMLKQMILLSLFQDGTTFFL